MDVQSIYTFSASRKRTGERNGRALEKLHKRDHDENEEEWVHFHLYGSHKAA